MANVVWLAPVVAGSAFYFLCVPIADNDLWGHVLFGLRILETGGLAETNGYSYTTPDHRWINHEILSECAFAWAFSGLGGLGLNLLRGGIAVVSLGLVAATCWRRTRDTAAVAVTVTLTASLAAWGFLVRPQIFSFLFLALLWDLLDRVAAGKTRVWHLWIVPPLVALWINTHGGVLAGLGVFVIFAGCHALTNESRDWRTLCWVALAAVMATLCNPYGLDLPAFLLEDVMLDRPIPEWAPVPLLDLSNLSFKLAALAWLATIAVRPRRPWEWIIVGGAIVGAFRHQRHIPLAALLAAPSLAESAAWLFRRVQGWNVAERSRSPLPLVTTGFATIALIVAGRSHLELRGGLAVFPDEFPVEAVRHLDATGLSGNLAVPFGWGEYALWHLHPRFRVSIDGRYTTAYPESEIATAWRYMDGRPGWERHLEAADVALADRRHATERRLLADPKWTRTYVDRTASVFVRRQQAETTEIRGPVSRRFVAFP